jgi:hypothetical protein
VVKPICDCCFAGKKAGTKTEEKKAKKAKNKEK